MVLNYNFIDICLAQLGLFFQFCVQCLSRLRLVLHFVLHECILVRIRYALCIISEIAVLRMCS